MISSSRFIPSANRLSVHTRAVGADYERLKTGAKHLLPGMKASHRLEIVARAFGWSTAAAMQAAFRDLRCEESLSLDAACEPFVNPQTIIEWSGETLLHRVPAIAPSLVAWLSRSRFKIQHPKDNPWASSGIFAAIEGLLKSINGHNRLSQFIGLPGQIGSKTWLSSLSTEEQDRIRPVAHHVSLAAALAICSGLTAKEISELTRDDLEFGHAPVERRDVSKHDGIEFGDMVGKLADWHLSVDSGAPDDLAFSVDGRALTSDQIDALVFMATSIAGQPSTIEDLRLASAILSSSLNRLSPEGCAARLDMSWIEIQHALPNEAAQAEQNWNSRLAIAEQMPGVSSSRNKAFHDEVFRGAGPIQSLLDDWISLIREVDEARRSGLA